MTKPTTDILTNGGHLTDGEHLTHDVRLINGEPQPHPLASPPLPPRRSQGSRLWGFAQFVLCFVLAGSVLAYLLWAPEGGDPATAGARVPTPVADVCVAGPRTIHVQAACALAKKLEMAGVEEKQISTAVLTVTGTVVASLRPANGKPSDYWQFNSPELLTSFTDWQKATADVIFANTQLDAIRQLADARVASQEKVVQRLMRLVAAGTDTEKDLAAAQTDFIQFQIQGRKEVHEAETALRLAQRTEAATARQLQQAGLEPDLLLSTTRDLDIVMADVPEGFVSRVKLKQGCEARFFGLPDQPFKGRVLAISPVLSKERRSLRVLFAISDPQDQLRPGMFADIGLGTDLRSALLIPLEAVIHVGRADYVLVDTGSGDWRVTEVQVGELHEAGVEILGGLQAGQQIAARGVILLKPYIIQAVQKRSPTPTLHAGGPQGEGRS